ncbi:MAG: sensor domain-containing diguanylate cyclase [Miltoncostaeaceae bacterium]
MTIPSNTSRHTLDAAVLLDAAVDLGAALQQIAASAQTALGALRATCYACAPDSGLVTTLYTTEVDPGRREAIEQTLGRDRGELPMTRLLDRAPDGLLTVEDLSTDPRVPRTLAATVGVESLMGVRLDHASVADADGRRPLGALFVSFAGPRRFGDSERATLAGLGTLASLALANTHLQRAASANLARLAAIEAEQAALLRVATRVAMSEGSVQAVYDVAAEEACGLLGATSAIVARGYGEVARVVSGFGDSDRLGTELPVVEGGVQHGALAGHRPVAVDDYDLLESDAPEGAQRLRAGARSAAAAPIRAEGRVWGVLVAGFDRAHSIDADGRERLQHFADLVGLATSNAESRTRLVERSTQDALTGLANHRTFFDRLEDETLRAERGRGPLALVMIDLDHFKRVNDAHGHLAGDAVLVETARRLDAVARGSDLLGRIGGEEFAWLMPDTGLDAALIAAERAREAVGAEPFPGVGHVTLSAGVAALADGGSPRHLFAAADTALYRAKATGRDRCVASERDRPRGTGDGPRRA